MRHIPKLAAIVGVVSIGLFGIQGAASAGNPKGGGGGDGYGHGKPIYIPPPPPRGYHHHPGAPGYPGTTTTTTKPKYPPPPPKHYPCPFVPVIGYFGHGGYLYNWTHSHGYGGGGYKLVSVSHPR
jgi:hypothetical protein